MNLLLRRPRNVTSLWSRASLLYATTKSKNTDWNDIITDAENLVGYSTSFLNLRWLLNDEVANVATLLHKLIGTNHPLLKTVKKMILQSEAPSWGLIVLLVSKAAGHEKETAIEDKDLVAGVLHSQRVLSEITEMIRSSHMLHRTLMNVDAMTTDVTDMNFGNKIALISGDYLLSTSYNELARIKSHELILLISAALRDLSESEFIGPRDRQNKPFPAKPHAKAAEIVDEFGTEPLKIAGVLGNAEAEWTLRNILSGASLLGKSCQGSLKLSGHSEEFQRTGYLFGKHLALSMQASRDVESIFTEGEEFSLVGAPMLFHLKHDPGLHAEIETMAQNDSVDYERLRDIVKTGRGLTESNRLRDEHYRKALEELNKFPESDSRASLRRILKGSSVRGLPETGNVL